MTAVPRPENIGDIYRVHDYPFPGAVSYGAAYRRSTLSGFAVWRLEMSDGDQFEWDGDSFDIPGSPRIELYRRNPLPEREST